MTLTNAQATLSLTARAATTGTNVDGKITLGQTVTTALDPDVVYSMQIEADANNSVGNWSIADSLWTDSTATCTVTDADGNDFEGVSLGLNGSIAVMVTAAADNAESVSLDGTDLVAVLEPGKSVLALVTLSAIEFTFQAAGDSVQLTIFATQS